MVETLTLFVFHNLPYQVLSPLEGERQREGDLFFFCKEAEPHSKKLFHLPPRVHHVRIFLEQPLQFLRRLFHRGNQLRLVVPDRVLLAD